VDLFVSVASIALDPQWADRGVDPHFAYWREHSFGNVLIEPDDRCLCIVPARGRPTVMLPFDGDQVLSIVLSKAVLLAAVDKIKDPTITSQLAGR